MKRLTVVCLSVVLASSVAPDAFGWGAVHGAYGGAAYRGPMGGTAVRGPGGAAAYRGPAGGAAVRGPYGGAAARGPYGGTAYRAPGGAYYGGTAYRGGAIMAPRQPVPWRPGWRSVRQPAPRPRPHPTIIRRLIISRRRGNAVLVKGLK